jgi:hypothetical protein
MHTFSKSMALQTIRQKNPRSKITLETFAVKLLDKIINAPSPGAMERYIAVAVRALGIHKVNGYIIQRFIDRVTLYLDSHEANGAQQQINTAMARERLKEFRQAVAEPGDK